MVTMDEESLGLRISGPKSVVLMPKGSTQTRKENIEKKAQPSQSKKLITMNVCEWLIKWPKKLKTVSWFKTPLGTDMKKIPTWIMQGYGTMALEASQQLRKFGSERPSHVLFKLVSAV